MGQSTSRPNVRNLIDNLSDTKSWADLANELEKYAAKVNENGAPNSGETIEMKDLLRSLGEQSDEQDEQPPSG